MGIRGLETFIDRIYNSEDRHKAFDCLNLDEFKLVIDGNQFAYVLSSLFKQGHYGGNYDQFYEYAKLLLTKLKPAIEIIIFDGAKESIEKCKHRVEQRISRIANLKFEEKTELSKQEHFDLLKEYPSLFNRNILYRLLNELEIDYKMCVGLADHIIALYANGHNSKKQKFTVMSKASFFNVYNLEKGYLSTKYTFDIFRNLEIETTKFPIFRLDKLMNFFHLESYKTWIYFCILLGNNDDVELRRNTFYFKEFKIDTRNGNLDHLIAHCKLEEKRLIDTDYNQIRATYQFKRDVALKKIDKLIELFEMKNTQYKFLDSINGLYVNDFDRLFETIKCLNCFHINCLVEDCDQDSVFQPSIDFLHSIYSCLYSKSLTKFSQIDEFIRTKKPSIESLVDVCPITADMFNKIFKENRYFNFLCQVEKKMQQFNIKDNLTILFVSLVIWQNWLDKELIKLDLDETDARLKRLNSINFIDAVLTNFIILTLNCDAKSNANSNYFTQEAIYVEASRKGDLNVQTILNLYNKLVNEIKVDSNLDEYYQLDLKLVHRMNEFQTIYYMLGALCKLNESKFDFLEPNRFLNCYFCVNYIKKLSLVIDENNNLIETDYSKLDSMLKLSPVTVSLNTSLRNRIDFCQKILNKNCLKNLFKSLKI